MTLQTKLNALKANFEKQAPKDVIDTMHRATKELRNSGILDRTLKPGDKAPEFALENAEGKMVRSKDLLSDRLMVLSIYRGKW